MQLLILELKIQASCWRRDYLKNKILKKKKNLKQTPKNKMENSSLQYLLRSVSESKGKPENIQNFKHLYYPSGFY